MRLSDILSLIRSYLILGIIVTIIIAVIFFLSYFIIYKKMMKGQKRLSKTKVFWMGLLICYIMVVFGATLLNRANAYQNGKMVPLLYSYKEAWVTFDMNSWRNIILNIIMFVPLGFLLPIGIKKCRNFFITSLLGFFGTIIIEAIQLLEGIGIYEWDDVLNNTIGTMIGFGFFMVWNLIISFIKKEKLPKLPILISQLPLIVTCAAFLTIFVIYDQEELGHLDIQYIEKISTARFTVKTTENYSEKEKMLPVYKLQQAKVSETEQFAKKFFENLGDSLDQNRNDIYHETAVYYSNNGNSLWIDYIGMLYTFTDFDTLFPTEEGSVNSVDNADEETIRNCLSSYMIETPKDAVFSNNGMGSYSFEVKQMTDQNFMYDGTINCEYYDNGKVGTITNNIKTCEYLKDYSIISEKEAFEKICNGEFNQYLGDAPISEIELGKSVINYMIDTKGFYQPVYSFSVKINQTQSEIMIPAISAK